MKKTTSLDRDFLVHGSLVEGITKEEIKEQFARTTSYLHYPVTLNGDPDHHITVKFFSTTPVTADMIEEATQGISKVAPKSFGWTPVEFNGKLGKVRVLELTNLAPNVADLHYALEVIRKDDYPDYRPHITVTDELWEKIKEEKLSPGDFKISVGPLTFENKSVVEKVFSNVMPGKSRPFILFADPSSRTDTHEEYVLQLLNKDKTFDLYSVWYDKGKPLADMKELKLNSLTPYSAAPDEEVIEDYIFQDHVFALPLVRLIFELADPTGETNLEAKVVTSSAEGMLEKMHSYVSTDKFVEQWVDEGLSETMDFDEQIGFEKPELEEIGGDYTPEQYKEINDARLAFARDYIDDLWDNFEDKFRKVAEVDVDSIVLYRCMSISDYDKFLNLLKRGKYEDGYKGIGVYWSWDKSRAECHWGGKGQKIFITAMAKLSTINLKLTAELNMHTSLGAEEAEIRLKHGSRVQILEVQKADEVEEFEKPLPAVADLEGEMIPEETVLVQQKIDRILPALNEKLTDGMRLETTEAGDGFCVVHVLSGDDLLGCFGFYCNEEAMQEYAANVGAHDFEPGKGMVFMTFFEDRDYEEEPLRVLNLGATDENWMEEILTEFGIKSNVQSSLRFDLNRLPSFVTAARLREYASIVRKVAKTEHLLEAKEAKEEPFGEIYKEYVGYHNEAKLRELLFSNLSEEETDFPTESTLGIDIQAQFQTLDGFKDALKEKLKDSSWVYVTKGNSGEFQLNTVEDSKELLKNDVVLCLSSMEEMDHINWSIVWDRYHNCSTWNNAASIIATKKKSVELPQSVMPTPMDDFKLDDTKKALLPQYEGKAIRADSFQDFQELLSHILIELQLTEDYRKSIAGLLNQMREEKELIAL